MELGARISAGNYRDCRELAGSPALCVKILRPFVCKKICGLTIPVPSSIRTLVNFGAINLNEYELDIYRRLPEELLPYFPKLLYISSGGLVAKKVIDHDGKTSQTLEQYGVIKNDVFWEKIYEIRRLFGKHGLWFLDVFHHGNNILVQKKQDTLEPVVVDFKRIGMRGYVFQPSLWCRSGIIEKFNRRFKKFESKFRG